MSRNGSAKKRLYTVRVPLGTRTFVIKLRKFRTNPDRRSKKQSQKILQTSFLSIREIAFSIQSRARKKNTSSPLYAARSTAASLGIVALGLTGAVIFTHRIGSQEAFTVQANAIPVQQVLTPQVPEQKEHAIQPSKPLTIAAPAIELNAPIITVGLNEDDTLETPPLGQNVTGWYEYSPTPGEIGPSVVVGHVDSLEGPSVFYRLNELKTGDEVSIQRSDKSTMTFHVDRIEQYDQTNFPTQTVFGNTESSELRLITCGGIFDYATGRYTHNTVVFASLIAE